MGNGTPPRVRVRPESNTAMRTGLRCRFFDCPSSRSWCVYERSLKNHSSASLSPGGISSSCPVSGGNAGVGSIITFLVRLRCGMMLSDCDRIVFGFCGFECSAEVKVRTGTARSFVAFGFATCCTRAPGVCDFAALDVSGVGLECTTGTDIVVWGSIPGNWRRFLTGLGMTVWLSELWVCEGDLLVLATLIFGFRAVLSSWIVSSEAMLHYLPC
jgi:hypothetical protein